MLTRLRGGPQELLTSVRGNIELWANLLIISWAIAFMLWQGVGFAIALGTVFGIWAILAVSLNLVMGFTGLLSVGHIGFSALAPTLQQFSPRRPHTTNCAPGPYPHSIGRSSQLCPLV